MAKREKLGHRLKRVRIARDLSLRETASKVGVSPTYLSRVENCLDPSPPTENSKTGLDSPTRGEIGKPRTSCRGPKGENHNTPPP